MISEQESGTVDYTSVTELSGTMVSDEQILRLCNRYYWAGKHCRNKDVIEVACGTGQGLGYLSGLSRSLRAGDYSEEILSRARTYYGDRLEIVQFDAQDMPFEDNSADVVIIFEAIYYLPSAPKFIRECRRVLRENGKVLLATANKDLYDFNPSPHSHAYYGVDELREMFHAGGFDTTFFGVWPCGNLPFRQRALRAAKKTAVKLGLIPRTMRGKRLLKRLIFGKLVEMPYEIKEGLVEYDEPRPILNSAADNEHKVIYCEATLAEP